MCYYLSEKNNNYIRELSQHLLNLNGHIDQFIRVKKILNRYSYTVDDYSVNGIGQSRYKPLLIKAIVDVLIVSQHLINHLSIKSNELYNIGFIGYKIDGNHKEPKIPRTFKKVLKQNYTLAPQKQSMTNTMGDAARKIMDKQIATMGHPRGMQFQLGIASEEAGELAKEISKFHRHTLVGDTEKIKECRASIVDELFDTLYTISYVMISANIITKDLNDFARIYVPQIMAEEVLDKYKEKLR